MSSSKAAAAACKPAASAEQQQDEEDTFSEPDYDYLDLSFATMEDADEADDLKKPKKGVTSPPAPQYIVGTLIVRIVAARDLEPIQKNGFGQFLGQNQGTSNPYASVKFGGQTQRTTEVYDTIDPVWPRGETMFMDVSLPLSKVTHGNFNEPVHDGPPVAAAAAAPNTDDESEEGESSKQLSKPILTVAMFHAMTYNNNEKYPSTKKQQAYSGDSDEPFLGMTSLDVTPLLNGKAVTLDKWLPLTGMSSDDDDKKSARRPRRGSVRIVVEYEASDPPPRPGDIVRFSRFVDAADLYPVPPCDAYRVDEVIGDSVIMTYTTPEGWLCSFQAHRFMLICEERHHGAVELCQEELASVAERLGQSPMIQTVTETMERLPQEGLLAVGVDAVRGGASLLERWLKGGVETAASDLVFATNWDGRFSNNTVTGGNVGSNVAHSPASVASAERIGRLKVPEDEDEEDEGDALPGMPCCPITGEPMINPVVAADGHTYERSAIARWLQTSDKSPLTGAVLVHKDLVPNYMLVSSLQESARMEEEDRKPKAQDSA